MIGFDMDGVICDLMTPVRQKILDRYGYDVDASERTFKVQVPGVEDKDIWQIFGEAIRSGEAEPYPEAPAVLDELYRMYREPIFILTARQGRHALSTLEWFDKYIPCPVDVRMVDSAKEKWLNMPRHITHFVEDRLRTANDIANRGKDVFLVNRLWNTGRETNPYVTRVDNLSAVLDRVFNG